MHGRLTIMAEFDTYVVFLETFSGQEDHQTLPGRGVGLYMPTAPPRVCFRALRT